MGTRADSLSQLAGVSGRSGDCGRQRGRVTEPEDRLLPSEPERAAFAEHEQLFARIEARDHAGAMEVLRRHLARISGPDDRHLLATLTAMAQPHPPLAANGNTPPTLEVDS